MRARLFHERQVKGSKRASSVDPWAAVRLIPFESGFELPVYLANDCDGSGRTFVVEKAGRIRVIKDGKVLEQPCLDIVYHVR